MNKLLVYIPRDTIPKLLHADDLRFHISRYYHATLSNGDSISVVIPQSYEASATLHTHGCTVLPGMHATEPIGEAVAALLKDYDAKPTETMRQVAARMHPLHGPAFHPDY